MIGRVQFVAAGALLPLLCAQTPEAPGLAPEVLQLARIKVKMEKNLRQQPNYTCIETIQRSQRRAPANRYKLLDTLRLEVAVVDGEEMYSWPGAREFQVTDLRDIVRTGAIGTGTFSSHARSVFLATAPTYTYFGREEVEGVLCARYDYKVPLNLSGFTLKREEAQATVAYHGSFWADAKTLDIVRLEVHADEIPPHLRLKGADTVLEYQRVRIGAGEFLLPARATTTLTHINDDTSRNEIHFGDCRQYAGQSFLSFEPPPDPATPAPAKTPLESVTLPPRLELALELETGIESGVSAVGDEIRAVVRRDAKRNKEVIVPKGAVARGRLIFFERISGRPNYYIVGMQFETLEFGDKTAGLRADLVRVINFVAGGERPVTRENFQQSLGGGSTLVTLPDLERLPGAAVIYVKGGKLKMPPGLRMIWRTETATSGEP